MKNENTQTDIEAHIRKLIDQQIKAVRDKNIDQALNNYDKDVLSFDVVEALITIYEFTSKESHKKAVIKHAEMVLRSGKKNIKEKNDIDDLTERAGKILK